MDGCLTSTELRAIYRNERAQPRFLTEALAPAAILSEKDRIEFDFQDVDFGMAPWVKPCDEGVPTLGAGWQTKWFKPAYVKMKDAINVCDNCPSWYAGERAYSTLTMRQKLLIHRADILRRHSVMLGNRMEHTIAKLSVTGSFAVQFQGSSGEALQRFNMSYGRDPRLDFAVGTTWDQSTATPMNDLDDMINTAGEISLGTPYLAILGRDVYRSMVSHPDSNDLNNATARVLASSFERSTPAYREVNGARNHGTFNGIDYWTYTGQYRAADGSLQFYVPPNTMLIVCRPEDVPVMTRFYGAIKDLNVLRPVESYQKEWSEPDPSAIQLLTQSAPLPAMLNPHCILRADVLPA